MDAPKTPNGCEWKELSYHLSRLRNRGTDIEYRRLAVRNIADGVIGFGKEPKVLPEDVLSELNQLFLEEVDPAVKGSLAEILTCAGCTRTEIQQLLAKTAENSEANVSLTNRMLFGLIARIHNGRVKDASVVQSINACYPILQGENEEHILYVLGILGLWLKTCQKEKSPDGDLAWKESFEEEKWREMLEDLSSHPSDGISVLSGQILESMESEGEISEEEERKKFLQYLTARNRDRRETVEGLTIEEMRSLDGEIRNAPLPQEFLEKLFEEENKRVVFLETEDLSSTVPRWPKFASYLGSNAGLTHVGLCIPP